MINLYKDTFVLLDGAMGSMLQKRGLALGQNPEILNITNSELIQSIHKEYIDSGSNIIYANTFGANRHKLENFEETVDEVIAKALENAKVHKKNDTIIALDVGPIGELLEPAGALTFDEAYDIFKEVVIAGKKHGANLIVFETMTDLYEVKAAVLAAKENTDLPIFVTMTFEGDGRTFTGTSLQSMAITLEGLGCDAIGLNCSLGPHEILPLIEELSTYTSLPLIAKPNAGMPDPRNGQYSIGAKEFGEVMKQYALLGVQYLGGCCGSNQEFIKEIKRNIIGITLKRKIHKPQSIICSASTTCVIDQVRIIGERINPTGKKRFVQALQEHDLNYIYKQALEQIDAGADILDINVGVPGIDERETMISIIKGIQSITPTPLQIDSSKYAALEAGLRYYNGKPILNSVNGETKNLETILPLAKKYGAMVIALTIDEDGIPKTAKKRFDIAKKILDKALSLGIKKEDIVIDCLALTVSAQQADCLETLQAMQQIKKELELQLVLGVSNISFGIPNRSLINQTFLTMAMHSGLTLPIINPNNQTLMDTIYAFKVLNNNDVDSKQYIERFNNQAPQKDTNITATLTLPEAISRGLDDDVSKLTHNLLETTKPLDIVNNILIPALDSVGQRFEKNEIFLPQLIKSANASCIAFDIIKTRLAITNNESIAKGKIILATVKGDVHDIGKNIVKVILENYGYQIYDLGKNVSYEKIIETAVKEDIKLIGLSALMTTTVESMKEIIHEIHKARIPCKIMVGGAVLTPQYAREIQADYYSKDARQAVEIAREVFQ